jgi:predicted transcriptional regulator
MSDEIKTPSRVLAIAEQFGDTPIAWREHENGSVTIVFNSKGKHKFEKEGEEEIAEVLTVIRTNSEAEQVVKTLTPSHKPQPKRGK